jgi:4-alpha-glucanotransferase
MGKTYNPVSTYRIQFNREFTFGDAKKILPYLRKSGIRSIYASPVFKAARGSDHGYDVTDPNQLNAQIGSGEAFARLLAKLKAAGIGWIQDIVPNHMAYSPDNPWIFDLLRKGKDSEYYSYFDLIPSEQDPEQDMKQDQAKDSEQDPKQDPEKDPEKDPEQTPEQEEKLLLPFLGSTLEETIEQKELTLTFGEKEFIINYFDNEYPVSESSFDWILEQAHEGAPSLKKEIHKLLEGTVGNIEERTRQFHSLYLADQDFRDHADSCMALINGDVTLMQQLITLQHYLPVHWQETEHRVSYRRFFSINGLICLNMQDRQVFRDYHQLIGRWISDNHIQGLRIDHLDGLYDPAGYLENIRELSGEKLYVIVEKILEEDEKLPEDWPIQGTTGYDFLALVNNVLTNGTTEDDFHNYLEEWMEQTEDFTTLAIAKKKFFLENRFRGELDHLLQQCRTIGAPGLKNLSDTELRHAIAGFLVHFPIYRMYSIPSKFTPGDRKLVGQVFSDARNAEPGHNKELSALEALFISDKKEPETGAGKTADDYNEPEGNAGKITGDPQETEGGTDDLFDDPIGTDGSDGATYYGLQEPDTDQGRQQETDAFFRRCMQFTGPIMAKGIEDTLFYSYHPFLAHNEVGDSPGFFGIRKEKFHAAMKYRLEKWPMAMNTTSTHDTKRGEDARARLNVLSDIPAKWMEITRKWREINHAFKIMAGDMQVPSRSDEYFIYQSLVAHLPMEGTIDQTFTERFMAFMIKAMREAKMNTSWSDPDEVYEKGTMAFIESILTLETDFLGSLYQFVGEIKSHGMINSLVQLILKNTVPGVPDTFQGNEVWNLDFVDPDNRKPVDYSRLSRQLNKMLKESEQDKKRLLLKLWQAPEDGKIKQRIQHLLLRERSGSESLFLKGDYTPLKIKGAARDHVMAFHRHYKDEHLVVILPLNLAAMSGPEAWKKTRVELPELSPVHWTSLFTGEEHQYAGSITMQGLFSVFPFAVLKGVRHAPARKAGILMHISSLPGEFGIGDFGPGATQFVDFLHRTGQRYWQILPLSVAEKATAYSPYSSASAFAGNALYVDPYRLVRDGLLDAGTLRKHKRTIKNRVKFNRATKAKHAFIGEAIKKFTSSGSGDMKTKYRAFLEKEAYWLNDFALFSCLRDQFSNQPWNNWPVEYRDRDPKTLEDFSRLYDEELDAIRFTQFLFSQHWMETKQYANDRGIEIFGDIPIYIDFNSADVWAHQGLFKLDNEQKMSSVAGVPPDYFNKEGQHWGMPLFDWKAMGKEGFRWWLKRIEKNLEWFDLLRLDHFRGFSAYWDIPADAESAVHGTWKPGPGKKLFNAIQKKFPHIPFVAEDLGMIDQDVYDLRDHYDLPGMKVVQFGFDRNMSESEHNPMNINFNSIVYTGTHDNNTIRGWYRNEVDKSTLRRIRKFQGTKLTGKNVHLEMIRIAYATQAQLVIIPMQDWLGLDENSRMNFPSTVSGNWKWKLPELPQTDQLEKKIIDFGKTFGRF